MTAAPLALSSHGGLATNRALAGDAATYMPGGTEKISDYYDGPMATLGISRDGANHDMVAATARELNTYKRAMNRGELSLAVNSLVAAAHQPITERLVTDLNTELGLQTPLADKQVAQAAAAKQKRIS